MSDDLRTPKKEGPPAPPEYEHDPPYFKEWAPYFIEYLAWSGNVSASAEHARIGRSTAYDHRNSNESFREAWDDALEVATDLMEAEARRRAMHGVEEPVYYQGDMVGTVRRYSDTLLIFLLKAHRPEKFRDRLDVTSKGEKVQGVTYIVENRPDDSD